MDDAKDAVEGAARLVEEVARHLVGQDPDTAQMEIFDLALSHAELAGAEEFLRYAALDAPPAEADFKRGLAELFCADAVNGLHQRLRARPGAFGFAPADLGDAHLDFTARALDPAVLVQIGEAVRERQGRMPTDHLDNEKAIMRDTFRQFTDEQVAPLAESIHRQNLTIPSSIINGLRELGCFGLSVPERYGGLKPDDHEDSLGMVVVTEELSRGSLGAAGSLITRPEIMARALLEGGTEAQRSRWLPGLAAGDPLCAISVTEPGTGSDVASVALRASKTEDGWRLNGSKTWCTFAGMAGAILVLARTDPDVRPKHRGLSLFVVEKPSTDGHDFTVESGGGRMTGRAIPTIGYRGMHSFEMAYDNFLVPDDALVGEEGGRGRGFYYTMRGFSGGRLQTAARATGLMRAAFEKALTYAEDREVFDRPVASYPLTLQKLARMAATIVACQQFTYAAARAMDAGDGQLEASLVKLLSCRAAEWLTREALQIHGGMGYAEESDVSRYFADARVLSIFEGAEETLALKVVGKALVGG